MQFGSCFFCVSVGLLHSTFTSITCIYFFLILASIKTWPFFLVCLLASDICLPTQEDKHLPEYDCNAMSFFSLVSRNDGRTSQSGSEPGPTQAGTA